MGFVVQELANPQEILEESSNERVVLALYEALSARDVDTVHKLLASDLEWWFHGPPSHQFMMRLLTGSATSSATQSFEFAPLSIAAFGSTVLVEGCDHARSISWVHAWTVTHGIITQVREYFNTSLTVTRLRQHRQVLSVRFLVLHGSHPSTAPPFGRAASRIGSGNLFRVSFWQYKSGPVHRLWAEEL
ncbi:senescence associated gene 20 [Actinidia rufa]|uniref:Senescence associated gene 20 n=1 Tax=Actinidia rufa TaxID=165716 RepID=A0A7J0E8Q4_9ERIC|nr:senescence associated gene 20 [Actinidia rufa]